MSPASQGPLEVERYIGSCLISSSVRGSPGTGSGNGGAHQKAKKSVSDSGERFRQPQGGYVVPGCECGGGGQRYGRNWAGLPLISMASRRTRKPSPKSEETPPSPRTPLSRLAIHTQGAPLILAGRYNNTTRKGNTGTVQPVSRAPAPRQPPARRFTPTVPRGSPGSDSLSVASDESSGHSENSLPRIIKPRKRRKKDRKPTAPIAASTSPPEEPPGESSSIVTLKPYAPLCYERRRLQWDTDACEPEEQQRAASPDEDLGGPQLSHEFEDVQEACAAASLCQCRYCDPAGLIWDVHQHWHSPFLTPPGPLFLLDDERAALRRSWSEPSAWPRNDAAASPFQETSVASTACPVGSSPSLEVSTEIVTSPNGHRDIEIKFYSSSPPAVQQDSFASASVWTGGGIWGRAPLSDPEQSAKTLGEEVNQLRLQVEE